MTRISVKDLKDIVDLTNSVPEEFRQKCFELLLNHELASKSHYQGLATESEKVQKSENKHTSEKPFILPIDVKAFLGQYGINEEVINNFFYISEEEIRPIYQLNETRKAKAQIKHALMMALESAIKIGRFEVEIEALRQRCVEFKCYDLTNFSTNIKARSSLFKSITTDQPLVLSIDGKTELADLLEELKGKDG